MTTSELPTLDQFIARVRKHPFPCNGYVNESDWDSLYVRLTKRLIGEQIVPTLDIANAEATEKGKGAFKRLIARLRSDYPDLAIYIENVLNSQFVPGLLRLGFTQIPNTDPPCFYLDAEK